jgi:hypothetical protein
MSPRKKTVAKVVWPPMLSAKIRSVFPQKVVRAWLSSGSLKLVEFLRQVGKPSVPAVVVIEHIREKRYLQLQALAQRAMSAEELYEEALCVVAAAEGMDGPDEEEFPELEEGG